MARRARQDHSGEQDQDAGPQTGPGRWGCSGTA